MSYYIQSVLVIVLSLNVASSVFRLLISFRKSPWCVQAKVTSKTCPIIVDYIKCKPIHGGLLVILQSKSRGELFIFILLWFYWYWIKNAYWTTTKILFLLYFILTCHVSFFNQIFESVISWDFKSQCFEEVKELHKLWFSILINKTNLHLLFVGYQVRKNTYQCL